MRHTGLAVIVGPQRLVPLRGLSGRGQAQIGRQLALGDVAIRGGYVFRATVAVHVEGELGRDRGLQMHVELHRFAVFVVTGGNVLSRGRARFGPLRGGERLVGGTGRGRIFVMSPSSWSVVSIILLFQGPALVLEQRGDPRGGVVGFLEDAQQLKLGVAFVAVHLFGAHAVVVAVPKVRRVVAIVVGSDRLARRWIVGVPCRVVVLVFAHAEALVVGINVGGPQQVPLAAYTTILVIILIVVVVFLVAVFLLCGCCGLLAIDKVAQEPPGLLVAVVLGRLTLGQKGCGRCGRRRRGKQADVAQKGGRRWGHDWVGRWIGGSVDLSLSLSLSIVDNSLNTQKREETSKEA